MTESDLEVKQWKIDDLIGAEYNPRKLSDEQKQTIKDSIKRFGLVDPVLVNINTERKGIIIGGHQRTMIARELGFKKIPCIELDLTLEKEKELNVRLNKNTGEFDFDLLSEHFEDSELISWGFADDEIGFFEMDEPDYEDLIGEEKNKPATMKITFDSVQQLQKAEIDIQELIDRKYEGAFFSISAGEI